jgi:hypothetical protein
MASSTGDGMKSANDEKKKKKNEVAGEDLLAEALESLSLGGRTPVDNDSSSAATNLKKIADWIEESNEILVLTGAGVVGFVLHGCACRAVSSTTTKRTPPALWNLILAADGLMLEDTHIGDVAFGLGLACGLATD